MTTVRRRRHDLAVLRSIGFTRRQTRGAIAWQATLLAVAGIVVGVPLGIATGRLAWRWLADDFPIAYVPPLAALAVLVVASIAVVLANALAAGPAHVAEPHPSSRGVAGRVGPSTSVTRWSSVRRRSASLPAGMATKSVAPIPASRSQLRGHRPLVADHRHVGRALGALEIQHRAVRGDVAVPEELFAGLRPAVGFVVGDDRGQRHHDAR